MKPLTKKSNDVLEDIIVDDETVADKIVAQIPFESGEEKSLKIDYENLKSRHIPRPPSQKPKKPVMVRKAVLPSISKATKPKKHVMVARPAKSIQKNQVVQVLPPSAVPDLSEQDTLKEYHILGTLEEFTLEAMKQGYPLTIKEPNRIMADNPLQTDNSVDNDKVENKMTMDEKNALNNWKRQINERNRQQEYLSKHMKVSKDMLIMNQSDTYRSVQEERTLIDRSIPSKDYGKGYRVGSEFWKQAEALGKDNGVSVTLNQTEKGILPPIEHIGYASSIKKEMGRYWTETSRMTNVHYPWWKSSYLHERKDHLQDVIDELDPHQPYIDGLEVIGKSIIEQCNAEGNATIIETSTGDDYYDKEIDDDLEESEDALSQFENVIPEPIFGPSLIMNGQTVRWEGPTLLENDSVALTIRLLFETETENTMERAIKMTNDGTTSIQYHWREIDGSNPFNMVSKRPMKRFYFNVQNGMILPGQTISIPFYFKSSNTGIFMERWQLETQPVLCAGSKIEIALRGIANEENIYMDEIAAIERNLEMKQNEQMARRIIKDILSGVKTPPRPSTPTESYITEEQIFFHKNEKLIYKNNIVNSLKSFHTEIEAEKEWDLSVDTILKNVLELSNEEEKEVCLQKLNSDIQHLHRPSRTPVSKDNYDLCYQICCEAVDRIVNQSMKIRADHNLPERQLIIKPDINSKKLKKILPDALKQPRTESRGNKKDSPVTRNKTPLKEKKVESPIVNASIDEIKENTVNDMNDPNYLRYLEKFYIQTYHCLSEMVDNMEFVMMSDS